MEYVNDLKEINDDEDFVKWISKEEDEQKIRNTYEANGYEEGVQKGIKQEKIQIAKNMLNENMDIKDIIDVTSLTKKEILNIK